MRCHSFGYGANKPRMPSTTPGFSAAHMMLSIRGYDDACNVIETHEQAGGFEEP
jgi:hypothetical protein